MSATSSHTAPAAAPAATASAGANVALVKYWGKRDADLNLPATGSISLTLDSLSALARVWISDGREYRFTMDGVPVAGAAGERMDRFLDLLAAELGAAGPLVTDVHVNFPVASGLASSAAIHCAIAAAAAACNGARLGLERISELARRGSGSASRSVHGGFVEWRRGERADGRDSTAVQLLPESGWNLAMAVAVTTQERKPLGSRDAMEHVARTSPLYPAWLAGQEADLAAMRAAIERRDLDSLGRIAEENCLRMHATCLSARPPVIFWSPATLAVMQEARTLREGGIPAYFTIDAGPQVKMICRGQDLDRVCARLENVAGVREVLRAAPGKGVRILEGESPWR
jgi:diphosphomevalonate decarboxylase